MMELHRIPTWEEALRQYLESAQDTPFEWGTHDCALFAASAVEAITGTDPAANFRGTYDSARGAAEALRQHGAGTLLKTVRSWLGEPFHPALAHRGDIVMKDRFTVGVSVGRYARFISNTEGADRLDFYPVKDCRYAFRIPY